MSAIACSSVLATTSTRFAGFKAQYSYALDTFDDKEIWGLQHVRGSDTMRGNVAHVHPRLLTSTSLPSRVSTAVMSTAWSGKAPRPSPCDSTSVYQCSFYIKPGAPARPRRPGFIHG